MLCLFFDWFLASKLSCNKAISCKNYEPHKRSWYSCSSDDWLWWSWWETIPQVLLRYCYLKKLMMCGQNRPRRLTLLCPREPDNSENSKVAAAEETNLVLPLMGFVSPPEKCKVCPGNRTGSKLSFIQALHHILVVSTPGSPPTFHPVLEVHGDDCTRLWEEDIRQHSRRRNIPI